MDVNPLTALLLGLISFAIGAIGAVVSGTLLPFKLHKIITDLLQAQLNERGETLRLERERGDVLHKQNEEMLEHARTAAAVLDAVRARVERLSTPDDVPAPRRVGGGDG